MKKRAVAGAHKVKDVLRSWGMVYMKVPVEEAMHAIRKNVRSWVIIIVSVYAVESSMGLITSTFTTGTFASLTAHACAAAVSVMLTVGMAHVGYKAVRREVIAPIDLVSPWNYFFECMALVVVLSAGFFLALPLLIFPAFVFAVGVSMSVYTFFESPLSGATNAHLKASWKITKGKKMQLGLYYFAWAILFIIAGIVPWALLQYALLPFFLYSWAYVYEKVLQ